MGEDEKPLVFAVRDTVEGIPPEAFDRIFEKFGQVESRKGGRTVNTGLGLTFCKLAVEANGVDSRRGCDGRGKHFLLHTSACVTVPQRVHDGL
jgi:K+-sensing histidine kinase KdpD